MTWFNEWFRYSAVVALALLLIVLPVSALTTTTYTQGEFTFVVFNGTPGSTTHTFPTAAYNISALVVGGGGGGPGDVLTGIGAGGGGGGGFIETFNRTKTDFGGTTIDIMVGSGGKQGKGRPSVGQTNGTPSKAGNFIAYGGGNGTAYGFDQALSSGASGGGSAGLYTVPGLALYGAQGKDGGVNVSMDGGCGGGGAGQVGRSLFNQSTYNIHNGADGGNGNISYITGTPTYYAGGGGGAAANSTGLIGGIGGLGGGGYGAPLTNVGGNGTINTGGGGGGGNTYFGGTGGSGIVILRYEIVKPLADFSTNVSSGTVRLPVAFTDLSITNPTAWSWNFTYGLGTANSSTLQNPTYTYLNPGTYTAFLNVSNASYFNTTTRTITVTNPASLPTASFTVNKTLTYLPNGAFNFTDTSTPNVYAWQWNWTTATNSTPYTFSTSQNPVHTFTNPGIYYVTVRATNYLGSITSPATPLIVNGFDAPVASYTISPTTGTPGALILFNDTSTVPSVAGLVYNWSFGTGSVELNPYSDFQGSVGHVYNYGGVYNINLTVSNYNGTSFNYTVAGVTISTEQRMTNWYSPHQVRFRVLDANDNPIKAAYINATAYESSLPGGFAGAQQVLIEMYGINSISASQMVSSAVQMEGYTGDDGAASFTMHGNLKYLVYVTDLSGNTYTKTFYPQMDQYLIRVTSSGYTPPQDVSNILGTQGNATLTFSEPNTTWCTMGVDYLDITGRTTNIAFTAYLLNNQTTMNYTSMAVTGSEHILINYTVPNVRGQQWKWYYNATVV